MQAQMYVYIHQETHCGDISATTDCSMTATLVMALTMPIFISGRVLKKHIELIARFLLAQTELII